MKKAAYDAVADFFQEWDLADTFPRLARQFATINPEQPSPGDDAAFAYVERCVAEIRTYHKTYSFRVMPSDAATGEFLIGTQVANDADVRLTREDLNANLLTVGLTGAGKTNIVHNVLPQLRAAGIKRVILETKRDNLKHAVDDPDCLVVDGESPIALLDVPFLNHTDLLMIYEGRWSRTMYSHEHGRQILYEAWDKLQWPASLADLREKVDGLERKGDTYSRRDAIRGTSQRLHRVGQLLPVPFRTRVGVSPQAMFPHSVLFAVDELTDVAELQFSYYVALLTQFLRRAQ